MGNSIASWAKAYEARREGRGRFVYSTQSAVSLPIHRLQCSAVQCRQCTRHQQHLPIFLVHSRPWTLDLSLHGRARQLNPAKAWRTGYAKAAARVALIARPDFSFSFHSRSLNQSESRTQSLSFGLSATYVLYQGHENVQKCRPIV